MTARIDAGEKKHVAIFDKRFFVRRNCIMHQGLVQAIREAARIETIL
jgi:hypothetical protein